MSEEEIVIDPLLKVEEEVVPFVSNEPPEIKTEAEGQGWTDFAVWTEAGKDPKDWRPASVFIERGKLFKQHGESKKQIDELRSQLKVMGDHNRKLAQVEYDKAVKSLKNEKLEALQSQDHERVMEIDEELKRVEDVPEVPETNALEDVKFDDWLADPDHNWYKDKDLQEQADVAGGMYRIKHPEALASEVYQHAENFVKKANPQSEHFKKDLEVARVSNNGSTTADRGKQKDSLPKLSSLPRKFQDVAKSFAKMGAITEKEFLQQTVDVAKSEGKTLDEHIRSMRLGD